MDDSYDGSFQTQDESGEDWWYGHANDVNTSGVTQGYLTVGYTDWVITPTNKDDLSTALSNTCYSCGNTLLANGPALYDQLGTDQYQKSGCTQGTAAYYDLRGNMVWCKELNNFDLQDVVQLPGGDFVMIGGNRSSTDLDGNLLAYNPTAAAPSNFLSDCDVNGDLIDDARRHVNVIRIDRNGIVQWNYLYGFEDFLVSDPDYAWDHRSLGFGIALSDNGDLYITGEAQATDPFGTTSAGPVQFAYVARLNPGTGYVVNKSIYQHELFGLPFSESNVSIARSARIEADGFGNLLLTGREFKLSPSFDQRGFAISITNSLAESGRTYFQSPAGAANIRTGAIGQVYHSAGYFLVGAFVDCSVCAGAGNNSGDLWVYKINPFTGGSLGGEFFVSEVHAYDLRSDFVETNDGGYALVTSVRSPTYNGSAPLSESPDPSCDIFFPGRGYWDTDAFVAKYDASDNLIWSTQFDSEDNQPRECVPGNLKRQECLYSITEDQEGKLVISGNTGGNFDDYYLVKLGSDCQVKEYYTAINGPADPDVIVSDMTLPSGTTSWSGTDKKVFSKIIVPSGSELLIDGITVQFADYAELNNPSDLAKNSSGLILPTIIVQAGGKLTLKNGAILKGLSACGKEWMWLGVQLHGNNNLSENLINQGYLDARNSTFENARIGVLANAIRFNPDGGALSPDVAQLGGGRVYAEKVVFKNCRRAVHFTSYPYSEGRNLLLSEFRECNFTNDNIMVSRDRYLGNERPATNAMLTMWNYHGNRIAGCNFEYDNSILNLGWFDRPVGIVSFNASYNVFESTDLSGPSPVPANVPTTFVGLYKGVEINGTAGASSAKIKGAQFDNNLYGVTLEGIEYSEVYNCNFDVSKQDITLPNGTIPLRKHFGVYATAASGYKIENNTFNHLPIGASTSFTLNVGIYNENSGLLGTGASLRLNDFTDLAIGTQMSQSNPNLKVDCNSYANSDPSSFDWAITSGVLGDQGTCGSIATEPANNNFQVPCSGISQILNNGIPFIYSGQSGFTPLCFSAGSVAILPCAPSDVNDCPQSISGPTGDPSDPLPDLDASMLILSNEITLLEDIRATGDKVELIETIDNDPPGQAKNNLLNASPYLSDNVLNHLVESNMPGGHKKQILVANSPLEISVMDAVENSNMSNGIKNNIRNAQEGVSGRQELEATINVVITTRFVVLNDIVRIYLQTGQLDQAVSLLEDEGTLEALCALVPIQAEKDRSKATIHIAAIRQKAAYLEASDPGNPKSHKLTKFCDFFQTYIEIRNTKGSLFNLSEVQEQNLRSVAAEDGAIAIKAQTILKLVFGEYFDRPGEDIDAPKSQIVSENTGIIHPTQNLMKVYPNPTAGWITIELPEDALNGTITILNLMGQQVVKRQVSKTIFSEDLSSLSKGIYLVSVTSTTGNTYLQKLVLK
ncbi:MAG: hypothetical protein ACI9J3_003322 [Parvicellaceae bacterium]|jgi:hypothetical protein